MTYAVARVELAAALRAFLDAVAFSGDRAEPAARVREAAARFGPHPPPAVPRAEDAIERMHSSRWLGPNTDDAWLGLLQACAELACSDPIGDPARVLSP
jgi:hypothetical protein